MKHVVIDLEMNKTKSGTVGLRGEIIEIGAVVLNDNFEMISEFMTYVKPEYNSVIDKKIERLTGIKMTTVESAPVFSAALKMFTSFCESLGDEVCLYAWSDSDKLQLVNEIAFKGYQMTDFEESLITAMYDFQREFDEMLNLENQISLKNALFYAGLDFDGRQHDALFDARNTAELLSVARTPEKKAKFLDKAIEYLTPKPCSSTLGDLFDFSKFVVA